MSEQSILNQAINDVRNAENQLASVKSYGTKDQIRSAEQNLSNANASLAYAQANFYAATQREQAKAAKDAREAAERQAKAQADAAREAARIQAEAEEEAARINAEAMIEAERIREEGRIDTERKAYMKSLSDEELQSLINEISSKEYTEMLDTTYSEGEVIRGVLDKLTEVGDERLSNQREIEKLEEKLAPKLNKGIIIIVAVCSAIVALILASIITKSIFNNTPALWTSHSTYGNYTNYTYDGKVYSLIKNAIWIVLTLIPTIASYVVARRKYKKKLDAVPSVRDEIDALENIEKNLELQWTELDNQREELEASRTYDVSTVINIAREVEWKAEYAQAELNERHYSELSMEDIVSAAKLK